METLLWIIVFLATYCFMEFMAWFTHKYIMHGVLWPLHKDHHKKNHDSWFERNDAFFIFYAVVSIGFFLLWKYEGLWVGLPIGIGIFAHKHLGKKDGECFGMLFVPFKYFKK